MKTLKTSKSRERQASPPDQKMERVSVRPSGDLPPRNAAARDIPVSLSTAAEAPNPAHEQIAARAYQLWEVNGKMTGTEYADWFEAEQLLRVECQQNH